LWFHFEFVGVCFLVNATNQSLNESLIDSLNDSLCLSKPRVLHGLFKHYFQATISINLNYNFCANKQQSQNPFGPKHAHVDKKTKEIWIL